VTHSGTGKSGCNQVADLDAGSPISFFQKQKRTGTRRTLMRRVPVLSFLPPVGCGGGNQTRSVAIAMPWPTPMHMVESAYLPPDKDSSSAAVPVMRAPDMPSG
jgi:hypothetical protein